MLLNTTIYDEHELKYIQFLPKNLNDNEKIYSQNFKRILKTHTSFVLP
jgi:hypothetical protein